MHLRDDINMSRFLEAVKDCRGNVFFESPDGDHLALRSVLSQFYFLTKARQYEYLCSGTLSFTDPGDQEILSEFLIP